MEEKLVTLAVHTNKKATILRDLLKRYKIDTVIEAIDGKELSDVTTGVRVRIKESDLPRALMIVESEGLFNYNDEKTYRVDDGHPRFLVPVDFSDYSLDACRVAFGLAAEFKAKVKILNVFYNPYYPMDLPLAEVFYGSDEEDKPSQNILERVQGQMKVLTAEIDKRIASGEFPSVNYSYSLREGTADEEIAEYCKSYKPSLLVMGTKGSDHNETNALGSVTANVIEMVNVPVLTIPRDSILKETTKLSHVAFFTNFSQRDLITFDLLVKFVSRGETLPQITLLHFNQTRKGQLMDDPKIQKVKEYINTHYQGMNIDYKLIDAEDMFESTGRYLEEEKIDLIAVNTTRRNVFVRIFVPSVSRKLLARIKAPMLVLRTPK